MPFDRRLPSDTPLIREVWKRYHAARAADDFERLFAHYLPLVHFHARRMRPRGLTQLRVTVDELASAGHVGLIQAIHAFNPADPAAFKMFSWSVIRRRMDEELDAFRPIGASGTRRRKEKAARRIHAALAQDLGGEPSLEEFAARAADGDAWNGKGFGPPSDAFGLTREPDEAPSVAWLAIRTEPPHARQSYRDTIRLLTRGMTRRERRVFTLFFLRGLLIKDVAAAMKLHRGGVNRVFTPMVKRLRADVPLARALGLVDYQPGDATHSAAHINRDYPSRQRAKGKVA